MSASGRLPHGCLFGHDLENGDSSMGHPVTLGPGEDAVLLTGPAGRPPARL